jgi:hypothetical protein
MKSGFPEEDPHCRELVVVAGDDYLDPLLEHGVFEPLPWQHRFPFQEHDFDGIGEQMAWLNEQAEWYENRRNNPVDSRQGTVRPYVQPDVDVPDVTGQSEWSDWTKTGTEAEDNHSGGDTQ